MEYKDSVQTDLISEMSKYLMSKVEFFSDFDIGDFRASGPRIALDIQAMEKNKRYLNGRVRQWYQFRILAKSEDWKQSADFLEKATKSLEKATSNDIHSDGSFFDFINAETSGSIGYAGTMTDSGDENNTEYVVYTVAFTVQATINN